MKKEGSLLVVDDNKGILSAINLLMCRYFEHVITLSNPNQICKAIAENHIDVVLLDMNFSASVNTGNEGLYWLRKIKKQQEDIQVVVFTAYADIELAVCAIKKGATDFVVKPWDNDKLIASLQNAYNLRKSNMDIKNLKEIKRELTNEIPMIWGDSPLMQQLRQTIEKVAVTDANLLITGENGTGKELLAREIHRLSNRSNELLVTVDMGSIVETLFESELFGHVRGAFTDAVADRAGKFEIANHSTLFLDEIGNLSLHLQARLLTTLQNKQITRVGSNSPQPINIRLICATNRDLDQMVAMGSFREDLLYRINTIHVQLPALRERSEDILSFANHFLKKYVTKYAKEITGFNEKAQKALLNYPWPGNIRELQHTIEKAVILSENKLIIPEELMLKAPIVKNDDLRFSTLEQMERTMIIKSIDIHKGNMSAVAEQLGITRQTLYNKIKRYEL